MKRFSPSDQPPRFKGGVRHYHRAASKSSSWEEWIDGEADNPRPKKNWLKIIGIIAALLALGGIIAGLVIELGWA
jgi:hypothetical protein